MSSGQYEGYQRKLAQLEADLDDTTARVGKGIAKCHKGCHEEFGDGFGKGKGWNRFVCKSNCFVASIF